MALTLSRIRVTPIQSAYSVQLPVGTLSVKHEGSKSRFRADVEANASFVNCVWQLDKSGYEYLRAFYRTTLKNGHLPFTIDLLIDEDDLINRKARFVPGTFKLESVMMPDLFIVSANLEVGVS
jgi:hypothetical protein